MGKSGVGKSGASVPRVPRVPLATLLCTLLATACGPPSPAGQPQLASRDASSAPEAVHPEAAEAISKLRSPFCPGLMLEVCTSSQAEALRDSIHLAAGEGLDADSLVERMLGRLRRGIPCLPQARGSGTAGVGNAAVRTSRGTWTGRGRAAADAGPGGAAHDSAALTDEERAQLDEALAEFETMDPD